MRPSDNTLSENCSRSPETADHPDQNPEGANKPLKQAQKPTGSPPVTRRTSPVRQ
jgi:hypothetical protein